MIVDTSEIVLGPPRGTDTIDQPPQGAVLRGDGLDGSLIARRSNITAIALIVLGGPALRGRRRRRSRCGTGSKGKGPEIPHAMRPGPSDTALETPLLNASRAGASPGRRSSSLWFPLQWLLEPGTNLRQEEELRTLAIARGELAVLPFTEENQLGVGCVRCHGPELKGGVINASGSGNPISRTRRTSPRSARGSTTATRDDQHGDDIDQVISEGRSDAVVEHPLRGRAHDQQINDIVLYLVQMSSENVPFEQNICINPEASESARRGERRRRRPAPTRPRDP